MQNPPKRQLRPTASLPTTAEKYGTQFNIPDHIQRALQNVGPKSRHSVAQGRRFDRTQSFPAIPPSSSSSSTSPASFQTAEETYIDARRIIHQGMLRSRELTPYSDSLDASASNRHRDSSSPERVVTRPKQLDRETPPNPDRTRSWRKRRSSPAEERSGSDTEVEADEDMPYLTLHTSASSTSADDFPRVFVSPNITQPELFARPEELPRPDGRRTKGLPGSTRGMARGFRKTVSAPVGMGWGGMEVDRDGEDGFDVSEWAASEEF